MREERAQERERERERQSGMRDGGKRVREGCGNQEWRLSGKGEMIIKIVRNGDRERERERIGIRFNLLTLKPS